jgi:hypothetical protein
LRFFKSLDENNIYNLKEKRSDEFNDKMNKLLFSYDDDIDKLGDNIFEKLKDIDRENTELKERNNKNNEYLLTTFSNSYPILLLKLIDSISDLQKRNFVTKQILEFFR